MKICIVGGSGFIGSRLASVLLGEGHEILILDPAPPPDDLVDSDRLRHLPASTLDDDLSAVLTSEGPEVVYHLAVGLPLRVSINEPLRDAEINITGSLRLLEACRDAGVSKIIFTSSGVAIYGEPGELPVPESCRPAPLSPYGVSKLTVEHYVRVFSKLCGMDYAILRFASVYGPGQSTAMGAGVVSIFAEMLLRGETPSIFGDGSKTRDYVFVDDVVQAAALALEQGSRQTLNIGSGKPVTDLEVFETVRRAAGATAAPEFTESKSGDASHIYLDCAKARESLGWSATTAFDDGVQRVAEFLKDTHALT